MQKTIYKQGGSVISKRIIQKIKETSALLMDRKVLFGIGIGLILGVILMAGYKTTIGLSDSQIEERARDLGMIYKSEQKSMFNSEGEK